MGRKGVAKERLLQTVSGDYTVRHLEEGVALQTEKGTARKRQGALGGGMTDPHRWRGDVLREEDGRR